MGLTGLLPQHVVDRMSPGDRESYAVSVGNPAAGRTSSETREKAQIADEKELQKQINDYLNLHGLEVINPPMHKRSMLPSGWPDHTTCYLGRAVAIEAKVWGNKPEPHQSLRHESMRRSGWIVIVAHSVADVQSAFRDIDAVINMTTPNDGDSR